MPTYEYICKQCHKNFEKKVSFLNEKTFICPFCKSKNIQKLLNAPGIIFKGKGFHKTDYAKKEACEKCPHQKECPKNEK